MTLTQTWFLAVILGAIATGLAVSADERNSSIDIVAASIYVIAAGTAVYTFCWAVVSHP